MTAVGIVTQARMTSTRLPGKVLLPAAGRSMLDHHLDRLAVVGWPVIVATTTNASDDPIADLAAGRGLGLFRGSENDVLSRYLGCAEAFGLDVVVRVTSDCPLIDGAVVAAGVDQFLAAGDPWLYLSNTLSRTFPRGLDFEVFSTEALRAAAANATQPYQREHVTPYLYDQSDPRVVRRNVSRDNDKSDYRLTLDTPADYGLLVRLIEQYGATRLGVDALVAVLDAHPELVAINQHVRQKPAIPASTLSS